MILVSAIVLAFFSAAFGAVLYASWDTPRESGDWFVIYMMAALVLKNGVGYGNETLFRTQKRSRGCPRVGCGPRSATSGRGEIQKQNT